MKFWLYVMVLLYAVDAQSQTLTVERDIEEEELDVAVCVVQQVQRAFRGAMSTYLQTKNIEQAKKTVADMMRGYVDDEAQKLKPFDYTMVGLGVPFIAIGSYFAASSNHIYKAAEEAFVFHAEAFMGGADEVLYGIADLLNDSIRGKRFFYRVIKRQTNIDNYWLVLDPLKTIPEVSTAAKDFEKALGVAMKINQQYPDGKISTIEMPKQAIFEVYENAIASSKILDDFLEDPKNKTKIRNAVVRAYEKDVVASAENSIQKGLKLFRNEFSTAKTMKTGGKILKWVGITALLTEVVYRVIFTDFYPSHSLTEQKMARMDPIQLRDYIADHPVDRVRIIANASLVGCPEL